ncbi:MAG: ribosome assembly RNA-binding protein YhbY [Gammaproteobacteria bacterium]|nr:ribosome assembly RNA-binding protein YhbY [Gammaproteobacteria bacterium]
MPLTEKQKKFLRKLAHERKVIVQTGAQGVTQGVVTEIDNALTFHELIKVKVLAEDRKERDQMIHDICARLKATLIQRIGHVACLFRPNAEKPQIKLP